MVATVISTSRLSQGSPVHCTVRLHRITRLQRLVIIHCLIHARFSPLHIGLGQSAIELQTSDISTRGIAAFGLSQAS